MNPSDFATDSWPTALVFIVFLLLFAGPTAWLTVRGNRQVAAVASQFENNGGSTIRDSVDRIESALAAHIDLSEERQEATAAALVAIDQRMAAVEQAAARKKRKRLLGR